MRLILLLQLVVTVYSAVTSSDRNGRSIERVMPEGPKVVIKSAMMGTVGMKAGGGRLRNSDFHEVFLTPYRYVRYQNSSPYFALLS